MDTRERCLWGELRTRGQEDLVVLRGLLDRYYDSVYRHLAQQLADRHVDDRNAILDLCDATFQAFVRRIHRDPAFEPDSLLRLLHQIADEKVTAFFSVLPFTPQQGETGPLDQVLRDKRKAYESYASKQDDQGDRKPRRLNRQWMHRISQPSMRPKMLHLALTFLLVGVLSQTEPVQRYTAALFGSRPSPRTASFKPGDSVVALSNAEREEGRKPWLDEGRLAKSPERHLQQADGRQGERRQSGSKRTAVTTAKKASRKTDARRAERARQAAFGQALLTEVVRTGQVREGRPTSPADAFLASLSTGSESSRSASASRDGAPAASPRHPRDPQLVHRIVVEHNPAIQDCYKLALRRRPDLQGKLVVRFTISPDGRVSAVETVSSTLDDDQMERCVLKRIRRWNNFPVADPDYGKVSFLQEYKFGIE